MAQPNRSSLHLSVPLTNLTVAVMQDDKDFVADAGAPVVDVDHRTDKYYTYPVGAWHRLEMSPRGQNEESNGSGWDVSSDSYDCRKFSVHKDVSFDDEDDADAQVDPVEDASLWLANQVRMYRDYLFAAKCAKASTWTTDVTGQDAAVSAGDIASKMQRWSVAGTDPQKDVIYYAGAIKDRIGLNPNTMIVGQLVHRRLVVNSVVRDALKYTEPTLLRIVENKLSEFFGIEKYIVAGAFYNSAVEGQTATLAKLFPTDGVFMGYVNEAQGKKVMTAAKTFGWKGTHGQGSKGVAGYVFPIPQKEVTRYEVDLHADVKIVSADAGAFIATAVT